MAEYSSGALEENPVQDILVALLVHSQSCRMKSTVDLETILVWTRCNASFCYEHSLPLWVCLSDVFSESADLQC